MFKCNSDEIFSWKQNSMNPDQTATQRSSLIWCHIVCNIGYLKTKADESRQQYHDWREKGKATNENVHLFSDVKSKVVAF